MYKILHITTHMGGGVGNALSSIVCADDVNEHKIIVLQKPQKFQYVNMCICNKIDVLIEPDDLIKYEMIIKADLIVVHWWNHPLMNGFLSEFPSVPVRVLLWCHVSGCTYPYLPCSFLNIFNWVSFTSKCSYDNGWWTQADKKTIKSKSNVVYGLGPLAHFKYKTDYSVKDNIVVGYIGSLTRSKIHPMYVKICKDIISKNPNIYFQLYGDIEEGKWIIQEAIQAGIEDHIVLLGYTDAVNEALLSFDIFGYPLNSYNYATTENSLLEAMMTGLPIVAMDQGTEKYIIEHEKCGLLSDDRTDYVKHIISLCNDEALRKYLGQNARSDVDKKFSFEMNLKRFQSTVTIVMKDDKKEITFKKMIGETPYDWFEAFLNPNDKYIIENKETERLEYIFLDKSKSSVAQYVNVYPFDDRLQLILKEIQE